MPNKDYYNILGVKKGASEKEIRDAYKDGAKRYHPDRQHGKSEKEKQEAEEKFKAINEAYQILSDPKKRQMYDTYGTVDGMGSMSAEDAMEAFMRHMSGGMFNGFEDLFSGRSGGVVRGSDIKLTVRIPLSSVMNGDSKTISYSRWEKCDSCHGTGSADGKTVVCPECNGTGRIVTSSRHGFTTFQNISMCQRCGGTGHSFSKPCTKCGGDGMKRVNEKLNVPIPDGIVNNSYITLNGKGNAPKGGGMNGDLHLLFSIEYPEGFGPSSTDMYDINMTLYVPVLQCLTGGNVEFKHANGRKLRFNLSQCVKDGDMVRLINEGLKRPDGTRGNLNAIIRHAMPKSLTKSEIRAIEKLKESDSFKRT